MRFPYTTEPVDATFAAQTGVGLMLAAMIWARPPWRRPAAWLLLSAIGLAVLAPVGTPPYAGGSFLRALGIALGPTFAKPALRVASALAAAGCAVDGRRRIAAVALAGEALLWLITGYIQDCNADLAALHIAFFGGLVGLLWSEREKVGGEGEGKGAGEGEGEGTPGTGGSVKALLWKDDFAAFAAGTLLGAVVCRKVLHGWTMSGDEWAYTYQASLFAKLRAYGSVPSCPEAFRHYWVFQYMARTFAMHLPGWSYFMTPFVAAGAPWLAGPASLGLLAAGVCRLGRRVASGMTLDDGAAARSLARSGGWFSAAVLLLGSSALLNGGSRFAHVFVAAAFAWTVEALCVTGDGLRSSRAQWLWGSSVGVCIAVMLATRPGDACTLGLGPLLYAVYLVAKKRAPWRAAVGATTAFVPIAALTLIVLRLEHGRWFETGYSLITTFHPWAVFGWSLPNAHEYRWGIPLAAGSYCWWPCSPAVALAGVLCMRGTARRVAVMLSVGSAALVVLYTLSEFGRGVDVGYGPRYQFPCIVLMSVGTGAVLTVLWLKALGAAKGPQGSRTVFSPEPLGAHGPMGVAFGAVAAVTIRLAPLLYPPVERNLMSHNRLHEAIAEAGLHHALVFGGFGNNDSHPIDLTENFPFDLYPNQDVIIAIDMGPESVACVREHFAGRAFYHALSGEPTPIVPY